MDSVTKNPYGSFFHAGDRTPTSLPQEGCPSSHDAHTNRDRPWDSTCQASQQVLHRVGASTPPCHPRAWAHPVATRLLAPTGQPACTCPYRFREKSVTSPPLRGAPCRPHLHKAANWQCYRQACLSYHGVGDSGRSAPPPPLPRGDTACTISLVSAGVCNGRCVHSPGLDGIRRALQQRCATAQQLQSTCKSDENHVETIQKGRKTKFMAIKRRFTRVLKTKTDGPPFILKVSRTFKV